MLDHFAPEDCIAGCDMGDAACWVSGCAVGEQAEGRVARKIYNLRKGRPEILSLFVPLFLIVGF